MYPLQFSSAIPFSMHLPHDAVCVFVYLYAGHIGVKYLDITKTDGTTERSKNIYLNYVAISKICT